MPSSPGPDSPATDHTAVDSPTPAHQPGGYTGRFAPSPTGTLHFGSLVAATGSFLQARRHGGRWLLRIEDIDPPREQPGAADQILRTLEALGMHWDGPVLWQSRRHEAYREAAEQLINAGHAFRCVCSRKDVREAGMQGPGGTTVYPGTCRRLRIPAAQEAAVRVQVADEAVSFTDVLQGPQSANLQHSGGDFVIFRRDLLPAYQLAVVVDDAASGITEIVRGYDLIDSTPRQIWVQQLLGLPQPRYVHLPVAVDSGGQKLSKQTGAESIGLSEPSRAVTAALAFLRQEPPDDLHRQPLHAVWEWAIEHWQPQVLQGIRSLPAIVSGPTA